MSAPGREMDIRRMKWKAGVFTQSDKGQEGKKLTNIPNSGDLHCNHFPHPAKQECRPSSSSRLPVQPIEDLLTSSCVRGLKGVRRRL